MVAIGLTIVAGQGGCGGEIPHPGHFVSDYILLPGF